jgi:hypothetical protein
MDTDVDTLVSGVAPAGPAEARSRL